MVVRTDKKIEAIGVIADLLPDVSPLQIGTHGRWRDREFILLGRIRLAWAEGSWTEWFLECANGQHGWLGEAQGFFTISFPTEAATARINPRSLNAGSDLTLADQTWRVMDGKDVRVIAAQGELPFVPKPNVERFSLDLAGPKNRFATIEVESGITSLFTGESLTFNELAFSNLRNVPGWSNSAAPQAARTDSRTVRCPHCAAAVVLRASGQTLAVTCGSCGTLLDPSTEDVAVIQRADAAQREVAAVLPLGARGQLDETVYELIGCMVRADTYASWSEYLLFNPWQGFRWLVTYGGHWSLVDRLLSPPVDVGLRDVISDGARYRLFARGKTEVKAVLGEFYWRVQRGEVSEAEDYIAPPKILSREKYPAFAEETWSTGKYISPDQIQTAFALPEKLERPTGIYLNQPNPYKEKWHRVRGATGFALLVLCALQSYFLVAHPSKLQISQTATVTPPSSATQRSQATRLIATSTSTIPPQSSSPTGAQSAAVAATTPPPSSDFDTQTFTISGGPQPVNVTFSAPLQNTWIDVDVQLVNVGNGEARPGQTELSYYYGYDSDGSWSEGSRSRTIRYASVVPGTYFLRVEPESDVQARTLPLNVEVRSGGLFWSNFFVSAIILLLYPAWILYRRHVFEQERWGDSDFSPTTHSGDDS